MTAAAQDTITSATANPESNRGTGYAGASIFHSSAYLGSAETETRALPYLSFEDVKGFDLIGTRLSYRLIETGTGQGFGKWSLRAGPSLSFQSGRDSDDSPTLTGFEDIGAAFPIGGYLRSTIGPVGFGLNAGQDIAGGHSGLTVDASVGTFLPLGRVFIQPSLTASWADRRHNNSYFGVSSEQSQASGLNAYGIGSGFHSYSAGVVSWAEFGDHYAISFIGAHRWFTGNAADSPILNASDGSKTGVFAAISLSRKFDTSKW